MQIYKVIGVMSGTSLDGLDMAYCEFVMDDKWSFKIGASATITYSEKRENILKNAGLLRGDELISLDAKFGKYIGQEVKQFCGDHGLQPDFISSHGHTVFHQPDLGFTFQIGNGVNIFAETGIPVVCDFRTQDVALGGQGAPLVPIGDALLFGDYGACLNLGGFANLSAQVKNERKAWDICALNTVLNHYACQAGMKFDKGGELARSGKLFKPLLNDLNNIEFYKKTPPKSLGVEWVQSALMHIMNRYDISVADKLNTYVHHVAEQISNNIESLQVSAVLVTGGGAYHTYLVETINKHLAAKLVIPDDATVQFKEALIFAFLGVLKWRGEVNVLKSVTGAGMNHSSGIIFGK